MTGWYPEPPGDGPELPDSAYEARSRARCPCGCQDAAGDGELDTPAKVRAALVAMTDFRVAIEHRDMP